MNEETEISVYEIAFGENARPEHLATSQEHRAFSEDDLLQQLEIESQAFAEQQERQYHGY